MKTVNDFLNVDCFVIKDTSHNSEVIGLQINIWGEHHLSDKYGTRLVVKQGLESSEEIWGFGALDDNKTLVLYI